MNTKNLRGEWGCSTNSEQLMRLGTSQSSSLLVELHWPYQRCESFILMNQSLEKTGFLCPPKSFFVYVPDSVKKFSCTILLVFVILYGYNRPFDMFVKLQRCFFG